LTTVVARRAAVERARSAGLSERHACGLVGQARSTQRYGGHADPQADLRERLKALALERVRWGYRRLHVLLRREGRRLNHKRVYRLYREEGLAVRRRRRKRIVVRREPLSMLTHVNELWAADFMQDVLTNGRRIRCLNVVDGLSREALATEVETSFPAQRVVEAVEVIALERGYPRALLTDNGPEFRSQKLDQWAYEHDVRLIFIEPGKPSQNATIESFNGRMRDECLNQHWFRTVDEARSVIEAWREDYNRVRPHGSLGQMTPVEYAASLQAALSSAELVS
jgi:putative transposase